MIVDFRTPCANYSPCMNSFKVERVMSKKFPGVHITKDLWINKTCSLGTTAQQCLYFLWYLKKANIPPSILSILYWSTTESILTTCITLWFGTCNASDCKTLQRILRTVLHKQGIHLWEFYHNEESDPTSIPHC